MAGENAGQAGEGVVALLAHGGEIATDAAEVVRPGGAAEAAGDLLLDFEHAQVALGQIVVEGHAKVMQER